MIPYVIITKFAQKMKKKKNIFLIFLIVFVIQISQNKEKKNFPILDSISGCSRVKGTRDKENK